jgi:hypothetical protein
MPRVEAALLRAAAVHESAAALHERAAEFFDAVGRSELASSERARAQIDRSGAADDRKRARLRHERLGSPGGWQDKARAARSIPIPTGGRVAHPAQLREVVRAFEMLVPSPKRVCATSLTPGSETLQRTRAKSRCRRRERRCAAHSSPKLDWRFRRGQYRMLTHSRDLPIVRDGASSSAAPRDETWSTALSREPAPFRWTQVHCARRRVGRAPCPRTSAGPRSARDEW